jgi:hypothetical protein
VLKSGNQKIKSTLGKANWEERPVKIRMKNIRSKNILKSMQKWCDYRKKKENSKEEPINKAE